MGRSFVQIRRKPGREAGVHLIERPELWHYWLKGCWCAVRLRVSPILRIAAGLLLAVLLGVVEYHVLHWRIPGSTEALLEQADEKSWVNNWIVAEPLYRQAELRLPSAQLQRL